MSLTGFLPVVVVVVAGVAIFRREGN